MGLHSSPVLAQTRDHPDVVAKTGSVFTRKDWSASFFPALDSCTSWHALRGDSALEGTTAFQRKERPAAPGGGAQAQGRRGEDVQGSVSLKLSGISGLRQQSPARTLRVAALEAGPAQRGHGAVGVQLGPRAGPSPPWASVPTAVNRGVAGRETAALPTVFLAPESAPVQSCPGWRRRCPCAGWPPAPVGSPTKKVVSLRQPRGTGGRCDGAPG